jgi:hypothetical protein
MADDMLAIGLIIRCMEKVYTHGLMAENIKDFISMIRNKARVNIPGQMVESIEVNGKMAYSMVLV